MPCPCLKCERCTSKSSMVSEGSNTTGLVIGEEFEVKEGSAAAGESREDLLPAALLLVAVCELDVNVLERELFNGQLLQANNDVISWCLTPCILWHQCSPDLLEFAIIKDSLRTALNIDSISSVDESFGGGGGQGGSMFESLPQFGTKM